MTEPIGNKLSIGGDGAVKPSYTAPADAGRIRSKRCKPEGVTAAHGR